MASSSSRSSRSATRCSWRRGSPARSASPRAAHARSATRWPTGCVDKRVLLVLDNFEQVVGAAPIVADLLRARRELQGRGHQPGRRCASRASRSIPVPGLPTPPDPGGLSGLERLALPGGTRDVRPGDARRVRRGPPVHRARGRGQAGLHGDQRERTRPSPRSAPGSTGCRSPSSWPRPASSSCRPTRSSPGWSTSSTCSRPAPRDLPERQQTLRGAIAWSYDLLDEAAKRLLDRLSVFASGCDLGAAEAICGPVVRARRRRRRRAHGARRPEPGQGRRRGRRRAALPDARHDPRVRRRAARGARRDGD